MLPLQSTLTFCLMMPAYAVGGTPSCLAHALPQDCVLHPVEPLLAAGLISGRVQARAPHALTHFPSHPY